MRGRAGASTRLRTLLGRGMRSVGRVLSALLPGYFIRVDFPPSSNEAPRYGYGRPPHRRLAELLRAHDDEYGAVLEGFARYRQALSAIPARNVDPREPHWGNGCLFGLDGVSLYGFTRERAPRRYVEVGSGNSTLFVDRARRDGSTGTQIISIDPSPTREVDAICDVVMRTPLEHADLSVFAQLRAGDVAFLDGTHRVFMNSDVVVFFLDVLPELPAGVLVGVHDIHLPDDYRPEHSKRFYSEQYMLAAYLLAEARWLQPVLPCWYVSDHPQLGALAKPLLQPGGGGRGVIFWMQTQPRA